MNTNLNETQISIIYNLIKIWNSNNTLRFNQLTSNLLVDYSNKNDKKLHKTKDVVDGFYLKDEEFNEFLEDLIDDLS